MRHLLPMLLLGLLSGACTFSAPTPTTTEGHFQAGEQLFEKGKYEDAAKEWEKARDAFYSPALTTLAEIKIAQALFMDENYVEAAAALEDFLQQHPRHDRTAQVLFLLGQSYQKQALSIDRDQTAIRNANVTFENLIKLYPGTPWAEQAAGYIAANQEDLASRDLYVGRFYLRSKKYKAAINRLSSLVKEYPSYSKLAQAYYFLGQSYMKNGNTEKGAESFKTLLEKFPESSLNEEAQKWLKKNM